MNSSFSGSAFSRLELPNFDPLLVVVILLIGFPIALITSPGLTTSPPRVFRVNIQRLSSGNAIVAVLILLSQPGARFRPRQGFFPPFAYLASLARSTSHLGAPVPKSER